jgi:hypothetical protein
MFDNRVRRKTSGPTKDRKRENGEDCIMKRFISVLHSKYFCGEALLKETIWKT